LIDRLKRFLQPELRLPDCTHACFFESSALLELSM